MRGARPGTATRVRDTVLVGDGVLRFTAESAEPMRRWLKEWRERRKS
jgi:hypothetical protein